MSKVMIFHAPYPMETNPTSASRLRPLRMREAFKTLGYYVIDVSGTTPQRRQALKSLRKTLKSGLRPDFFYSENSTQPNLFATSIKDGFAPTLDYRIMRQAHQHNIPIGVFYRDIYWRFPQFAAKDLIGRISPLLHRLDMCGYQRNNAHLFLPSLNMAEVMGLDAAQSFSALPPAGNDDSVLPLPEQLHPLRLFYVGGIGGHYRLDKLIKAVAGNPNINLELVTRKPQWKTAIQADSSLKSKNIHPHHLDSWQLAPLYAQSLIAVLLVEPTPYRDFAAPVKLFEYISRGRPILVSAGTEAARIVSKYDAGWVVDYEDEAIANILRHLQEHPEEIAEKAAKAAAAAMENTWTTRARQVAQTLCPPGAAEYVGAKTGID